MNIYQADVICSMVTYISGCASHATASILVFIRLAFPIFRESPDLSEAFI